MAKIVRIGLVALVNQLMLGLVLEMGICVVRLRLARHHTCPK